MAWLGYARVSSKVGQDPQRQVDELQAAGCERVFVDHGVSGSTMSRPQWDALLSYARSGDVVVLTELSRAGRTVRGLLACVLDDLEPRGIGIKSLTQGIDTSADAGPMGKLLLTLFAALAELERDVLIERTKSGLAAARARGRVGGRPTVLPAERWDGARALLEAGKSITEVATTLGVSRTSVYRALEREKAGAN